MKTHKALPTLVVVLTCSLFLAGTGTLAYNGGDPYVGIIIRNGGDLLATEVAYEDSMVSVLESYQTNTGETWYMPLAEIPGGHGIPVNFQRGSPYIQLVRDLEETPESRIYLRVEQRHEYGLEILDIEEYVEPENVPHGQELDRYIFRIAMPMEEDGRILRMLVLEMDNTLIIPLIQETFLPNGRNTGGPVARSSMLEDLDGYTWGHMKWEALDPGERGNK